MKRTVFRALLGVSAAALLGMSGCCTSKKTDDLSQIPPEVTPHRATRLRGNQQVQSLAFTGNMREDGLFQASFRRAARGWTAAHFSSPLKSLSLKQGDKELATAKQLVHHNQEFILELPSGEFTLTAEAQDGKPVHLAWLHAIPEIYFWAPAPGFTKPLEGTNSFDELGEQLFDSLTGFFPGALTESEMALCREKGRFMFGNVLGAPLWNGNQDGFFKAIEEEKPFTNGMFDAVTVDEFVLVDDNHCNNFAEALPKIQNPGNLPLYTWFCGGLFAPEGQFGPAQKRVLHTVLNRTPGGRGAALLEIYLCGAHHYSDMASIIQQQLLNNVRALKAAYPPVAPRLGIVLGSYNAVPVLTLENDPNIDYKYFLDYQMNVLANHPEFKGIPIVGTWGGNYAQIDFQRWTLALLRHYFVRGGRGMLSEKFGFTPELHFSENGDFRNGLTGWNAKGEVKAVRSDGWVQGRWGGGSETAASLTGSETASAELSQKLTNLVPGRTYMLQYVVIDAKDLAQKIVAPRKLALTAELSDVKVVSDQLYIDDWRAEQSARYRNPFGRSNLRRIVFVPEKSGVTLKLTNPAASPDRELLVNFVQVKPFFTKEMLDSLP